MDPKESEIWVLLISYYFESDMRQRTSHRASSWLGLFMPYLERIFVGIMKSYLPQKSSTDVHFKLVKSCHCGWGWIWNTWQLSGLYQV